MNNFFDSIFRMKKKNDVSGGLVRMIGYCMKCKDRRDMVDMSKRDIQTTRGLKHFVDGKCSVCGTKMCVVVKGDTNVSS